MTIWVCTNGRASEGAFQLAKQDGFKRAVYGKFIKADDLVINWGSGAPLALQSDLGKVLNAPAAVKLAINKLTCFKALYDHGVPTVEWTADKSVAQSWSDAGDVVIMRTKLTGHEGDGIIVVEKHHKVQDAPLYTKYVFKEREYRCHVVNGVVIDTAQKIRDPNREPTTWKIRSWKNGFIFARNNVKPNELRDAAAIAAIKAVGLNFGAVDLIEDKFGNAYVLEINTGPGIEGKTVQIYADAFRALANA